MSSPSSPGPEFFQLQARRRAIQTRYLMVFAIGSSMVLVFYCVPLVIVNYMFGPAMVQDPAAVLAVSQKIAPLAIPPDFAGALARSADNSLWNVELARFDHAEGRGRLLVGQLHLKIAPQGSGNEHDELLLQKTMDDLFPGMKLLDAKSTRKQSITFHGQKVTFEIVAGEDRASTTQLTHVTGKYTGPQGAMQLVLQVESDFITDDAIDALVKSLDDSARRTPDSAEHKAADPN